MYLVCPPRGTVPYLPNSRTWQCCWAPRSSPLNSITAPQQGRGWPQHILLPQTALSLETKNGQSGKQDTEVTGLLWSLSPCSANISLQGGCNLEHSSTYSKIWAHQAITGSCCAPCSSLSNWQISGLLYCSEYWSVLRSSTRLSSNSSGAFSLQWQCWTFLPTFASNLILRSFVGIWCGRWLEKVWDNSRIFLLCVSGEGISGHLEWESAALCRRTSTHTVCNGPKRFINSIYSSFHYLMSMEITSCTEIGHTCFLPWLWYLGSESVLYCQEHDHRLTSAPYSNSTLCRPGVAQTEMLWLPAEDAYSSSKEDKTLKCAYFYAE